MDKKIHLVITALGTDKPGIVDSLSSFVLNRSGNIEDSRMSVLGGEFAVMMLISGSAACIQKIGDEMHVLEKSSGLTVICKQTSQQENNSPCMPYQISIAGLDHPGMVYSISSYFAKNKINIQTLETTTYKAPVSGTPLFKMETTVSVPSTVPVSEFYRQIEKIAEEENFDIQIKAAV